MDDRGRELLGKMTALCSRREYCEADIRKKLAKARQEDGGIAADAASRAQMEDDIIDFLKKEKFIDDLRYATAFVRDKSALAGWGRVKIRHALSAKGVSRECVETALAELDGNPGLEKLEKALKMKAAKLRDDPHCKFKLLRFALGRGYEYDEIRGLVDAAVKAQDEE